MISWMWEKCLHNVNICRGVPLTDTMLPLTPCNMCACINAFWRWHGLFGTFHRFSRQRSHSHHFLFTRLRLIKITDSRKYPSISPCFTPPPPSSRLHFCCSANTLRSLLINCSECCLFWLIFTCLETACWCEGCREGRWWRQHSSERLPRITALIWMKTVISL